MAERAAITSLKGTSSELRIGSLFSGKRVLPKNAQVTHMPRQSVRRPILGVRAMGDTVSKGMTYEDGGRWLSSTTRHIRIYAAYIDPETNKMDQTQTDKLSLILDPDDEFVWTEDKAQKVFDEFKSLVDNYAGADLTEYTLRLIGSDLEHFIRQMLLKNEIKYNLNCRVLNFSMGKPRLNVVDEEEDWTHPWRIHRALVFDVAEALMDIIMLLCTMFSLYDICHLYNWFRALYSFSQLNLPIILR
ncbi:hypothetical protein GOP47_0015859 [Adiantum capillus-veneris]|uniref:NAD(P)H-quinone oxidoreductase subunit M, chloroplastic n=1 Tax=Adiantum capillus-veneris TaxID=13818 RepID=A0A9D4ULM1_ADICA|nr:hypothetical protein GOP47_0015859 [Adiantum capillus-veneris]